MTNTCIYMLYVYLRIEGNVNFLAIGALLLVITSTGLSTEPSIFHTTWYRNNISVQRITRALIFTSINHVLVCIVVLLSLSMVVLDLMRICWSSR